MRFRYLALIIIIMNITPALGWTQVEPSEEAFFPYQAQYEEICRGKRARANAYLDFKLGQDPNDVDAYFLRHYFPERMGTPKSEGQSQKVRQLLSIFDQMKTRSFDDQEDLEERLDHIEGLEDNAEILRLRLLAKVAPAQALELLTQAQELEKDLDPFLLHELMIVSGQDESTLGEFELADEKVESFDGEYRYLLEGASALQKEEYTQALGFYEKALEFCPADARIFEGVVRALFYLESSKDDEKFLERLRGWGGELTPVMELHWAQVLLARKDWVNLKLRLKSLTQWGPLLNPQQRKWVLKAYEYLLEKQPEAELEALEKRFIEEEGARFTLLHFLIGAFGVLALAVLLHRIMGQKDD